MHDLTVIGLGALGVHAAAEAAARGLDVVGIDARGPAHELGATGGRTRIFRTVYTFGGDYVPALLRAREAWDRLDARHAGRVRDAHGALLVGAPDDPEIVAGLTAARDHGLQHEVLDAAGLAARWPQHRLLPGDVAIADPSGALLRPQAVTAAVSADATAAGARLRYDDPVVTLEPVAGGHEVVTASGARIRTRRVLVAAGAWTSRFAPGVADAVELRRVVLQWFRTDDPPAYAPERFPVGLRRSGDVRYSFFPQIDADGIKVNLHLPKAAVADVDDAVTVDADYGVELEDALRATLPGVRERTRVAALVEAYTPDYRILVDRIAGRDEAWLLAAGSGQAFKLAPVLAEHTVSRLLDEEPVLPLEGVVRGLTPASIDTVVGP